MVAAPESTVDAETADGRAVTIELRSEDEVLHVAGTRIAPDGARAYNPAFDVTPADLVTAVVTEQRVVRPAAGGTITRPCAMGLSGNYPGALDGLARVLSLDMRVIDPAWIGMKLRKLLNYAEPLGHFMAFVPGLPHGERRQQTWPSTVAYLARLIRRAIGFDITLRQG